jgi:hypothetical protein
MSAMHVHFKFVEVSFAEEIRVECQTAFHDVSYFVDFAAASSSFIPFRSVSGVTGFL